MDLQTEMTELIKQKDEMEKEIAMLVEEVEETAKAEGYDKPLVDSEGFPRADLDYAKLSAFRLRKKRLAELKNDHLDLMAKIERGLITLHREYKESGKAEKDLEEYEKNLDEKKAQKRLSEDKIPEKDIEEVKKPDEKEEGESKNTKPIWEEVKFEKKEQSREPKTIPVPFASISQVMDGSPAYKAGLRLGDLIAVFGNVHCRNHEKLTALPVAVRNNIDRPIDVAFLRKADPELKIDDEETYKYKGDDYVMINTVVTPTKWAGEGVLGCRFSEI